MIESDTSRPFDPVRVRCPEASDSGSDRWGKLIRRAAADMVLPDYLADVAKAMSAKSAAIRRDFAKHRLSAGENHEKLVEDFLAGHHAGGGYS